MLLLLILQVLFYQFRGKIPGIKDKDFLFFFFLVISQNSRLISNLPAAHWYSFLREKGTFVYCFVQQQNRVPLEESVVPPALEAGLLCQQRAFIYHLFVIYLSRAGSRRGRAGLSHSQLSVQGMRLAARGQQLFRNGDRDALQPAASLS